MKKSAIAAIATAAALVIGGGTAYALSTNASSDEGPALIEATATSTPTEAAAPEADAEATQAPGGAAPFVANVPEPTAPTVDETHSKWRTFVLKTIAMNDAGYFQEPSDADPIGQYICNQHRAGVAPEDIVAIQNLPAGREYVNTQIVDWTLQHGYTPNTDEEVLPDFCGTVFLAE